MHLPAPPELRRYYHSVLAELGGMFGILFVCGDAGDGGDGYLRDEMGLDHGVGEVCGVVRGG
jgi:hypothetical protein